MSEALIAVRLVHFAAVMAAFGSTVFRLYGFAGSAMPAAGLWLGGLLPLGWLLRRARQAGSAGFVALVREALRPFSQIGYAAVGLIAITGAINTAMLVGSLGGLFGTAYGRLLSLKIVLFLAMVVVALVNRFRLAPRMLRHPSPAALYRSVLIEQALGLGILAAVSGLGTWPPAAVAP